jgi:hypothetical protein
MHGAAKWPGGPGIGMMLDPGRREAETIKEYLTERMVGYQILFDT